jgi:hypothetical protein
MGPVLEPPFPVPGLLGAPFDPARGVFKVEASLAAAEAAALVLASNERCLACIKGENEARAVALAKGLQANAKPES